MKLFGGSKPADRRATRGLSPQPRHMRNRAAEPLNLGRTRKPGSSTRLLMMQASLERELSTTSGQVFGAAWAPTSERLVTAGLDSIGHLWNSGTGQFTALPHASLACAATWSPTGMHIATGTSGGTVHLWDPAGTELRRAVGHGDEVRGLDFTPDGTRLASTANDGTVRIWSVPDLTAIASLAGHVGPVRMASWSPNGRLLGTASHDLSVRVWDAWTFALLGVLTGHAMWIATAAYSPDSRLLASASCDSSVRVWDMRRATYVCVLTEFDDAWVTDLSWSPDGRYLASIDVNGIVRVWHGMEVVLRMKGSGWCRTVDWSPDGRSLATGGMGNVQIWSVGGSGDSGTTSVPRSGTTALPNATVRFDGLYQLEALACSSFIRFRPDGRVFAASSTGAADEVAEWLGAPGNESIGAGAFETRADGGVEFTVVSEAGAVDYRGRVLPEGHLALDVHSHINGNRTSGQLYRFVRVRG